MGLEPARQRPCSYPTEDHMSGPVPPRIYCVSAPDAPIIAVFRRGPTNWSHVGRWDVASLSYEPGAWLSGRIFPRRCDLSPDGRFLCYFAHKPSAKWAIGDAYCGVQATLVDCVACLSDLRNLDARILFYSRPAGPGSAGSAAILPLTVHSSGAVCDGAATGMARSAGFSAARCERRVGRAPKRPSTEATTRRARTPTCRKHWICRSQSSGPTRQPTAYACSILSKRTVN